MSDFFLHGGTLALAWFLLVNVVMSAVVAAGAAWIIGDDGAVLPAFWFAARVLPAAAALFFVGVVFVPSYWHTNRATSSKDSTSR